jgi:hypothetical protein
MQKLNENNDLCSLALNKNSNFTCGFLGLNCTCNNKDRCAYKLSEHYFKPYNKNEKSTIETIREIEKKYDKILKPNEILAITPKTEILNEKGLIFIIDKKGNILNLRNHNQICRNFKQ